MPVLERTTVGIPSDLRDLLRERVRQLDGEDIATAPLANLIRYAVARFAGIPQDQAIRYLRALPRGREETMEHYPRVGNPQSLQLRNPGRSNDRGSRKGIR